jgi:sugar/nucleoside kinase (ribokinase family)
MRRACLIASVSVTRAGTQSAYPSAEELPSELLVK